MLTRSGLGAAVAAVVLAVAGWWWHYEELIVIAAVVAVWSSGAVWSARHPTALSSTAACTRSASRAATRCA